MPLCSLSTTSISIPAKFVPSTISIPSKFVPSTSDRCFDEHSTISIPSTSGRCLDDAPPPYSYPPPPPYGYPSYPYPPPPTTSSMGAHSHPTYSYPPHPTYPYPPPQLTHSRGGDHSSGGENTSQTIQAPTRSKKRNKWTCGNEKILVGLNFILSLSFF
jgi:hypothetical protein